jgi:hypothetical protein
LGKITYAILLPLRLRLGGESDDERCCEPSHERATVHSII